MKIGIIIRTYKRKQGTSKKYLTKMFHMLENQTYKNFKVFIIGDNYSDNKEFEHLCNSYNGNIYYFNSPIDYRTNYFKIQMNKWTCGGNYSNYIGIKKAIEENYDYYFHLDDDDIWTNNHIENYVKYLKLFPKTDFMICKSKYKHTILPKEHKKITIEKYNNFSIKSCNSVHSSWCINLNTLGNFFITNYQIRIDKINKIRTCKIKEEELIPMDANLLNKLKEKQKLNIIKAICLNKITCSKLNDVNIPL